MIIKLTLGVLIILLIAVIGISYYMNEEGFQNITAGAATVGAAPGVQFGGEAQQPPAAPSGMPPGAMPPGAMPPGGMPPGGVPGMPAASPMGAMMSPMMGVPPSMSGTQAMAPQSARDSIDINLDVPQSKLSASIPTSTIMSVFSGQDSPLNPSEQTKGASQDKLPGVQSAESAPAPSPLVPMRPPMPSPLDSVIPQRNDVVPEVAMSKSGFDAASLQQRMDLLKDIQKVVRNEMRANRSVEPVGLGAKMGRRTESIAQGQEYEDSCYKDTDYKCPRNPDGSCPPIPDMANYIKKDEIPCWGCTLDY